jgi:hypothetical protein
MSLVAINGESGIQAAVADILALTPDVVLAHCTAVTTVLKQLPRDEIVRRDLTYGRPPLRSMTLTSNVLQTGHRDCSIGAGCSQLAWRLSGPAFACMRECAHLAKAE